ncbi:DEAD/DEAH box helicase [Prevotella sp. P2-180]|uniref:DEAD/DEAH box helicase n=1 Tax=Prevotella sp. P2-180 TaxID=2024224 RepID=UPI000B96F8B8|nr:DEAD/DEAH box helicase [Prevotella sp. P2-180]OYP65376.1 hypothetical protein CIK98_08745 [Prevotella sp. P2-180]
MLRDYQIEICEKVNEAFKAHRSVMVQMPTGTGKTMVLATLVIKILKDERIKGRSGKILIVAHRRELIEQIQNTLKKVFFFENSPVPSAEGATAHISVMSIQWLSRNIDMVRKKPDLVIIDEAHHALAKTYQMLWTAWPEAKFLGLTATPYRMSGDGFTDLFEVLVDSWSVKRFIADGWLSPYDYYSIRPDSEEQKEIDSLKKRGADGDFQMKELREKLDVRPSIERLFESFERFAFDKKGIIYAIDIAHAKHIAEFYRLQGVNAVAISSKTPAKERAEVIRTFKDENRIQILVSVDLFSEGFDCPDVEFIQLARPTLSLAKYLQMVGRGLRPCKGKQCCTIIDNVGLYRAFGLPSVDRDWGTFFYGLKDERIKELKNNDLNLNFLGLHNDSLSDGRDENLVKIVSHEGMRSQFTKLSMAGFERRKKGKVWVWIDRTNGVEFDRHPKVIYYRGMEMSTADGDSFFPRISSKWIDAKHGISRKALETQVGDGIGWMKLYISFAMPDKVLQLQAVKPNLARIYKDEQGKVFLQQDPDHAPICEEEAGGRKAFMTLCDKEQKAWEETKKSIRKSSLKYDAKKGWWQLPEGSIYRHRPVLRKRGFVELLYDGDVVYILNIREERFMPYRNWEIRADERICAIGNKLYFCKEKDMGSYRIKKRSDDFRMFVVEERYPNRNPNTMEFDEFIIINEAGKKLELKTL